VQLVHSHKDTFYFVSAEATDTAISYRYWDSLHRGG